MTLRDAVAGASVVVVSVILAACGGSATAARPIDDTGVCGGQTGVSTATSQKYVVVLVATTQVVPGFASPSASPSPTPQPPAVLSGTEAAINGPGATHLELHVCDRSTGAVVTGLHPEVTLRNVNGGAPLALPVAVVQDAGQGVNGTAYANNVRLDGVRTYAIDVRLDAADSLSLSYTVPVIGPVSSPPPGCLENHQLC